MNIALLILSAPYQAEGSRTALNFAHAAVEAGHQIQHVFFFSEGASNGAANEIPPSDEVALSEAWSAFAGAHGVELDACVSSAMKRGLLDANEARRYHKNAATLDEGFLLAGLGQLAAASLRCDRVVTF